MSESLFTSQTPGQTDNADGSAPGITTATSLYFAADGTVSGIRFYATTTVSGTYLAELWSCSSNSAGTRIASASVASGSIVAGTWNVIVFSSPVAVTAGVMYRAALNNSAGRYVATTGFFTSADLVNGNITGVKDSTTIFGSTFANAVFADGTAGNTFPSTNFGEPSYFVDVVFDITGSGTNAPAEPAAVTVSAPAPTAAVAPAAGQAAVTAAANDATAAVAAAGGLATVTVAALDAQASAAASAALASVTATAGDGTVAIYAQAGCAMVTAAALSPTVTGPAAATPGRLHTGSASARQILTSASTAMPTTSASGRLTTTTEP